MALMIFHIKYEHFKTSDHVSRFDIINNKIFDRKFLNLTLDLIAEKGRTSGDILYALSYYEVTFNTFSAGNLRMNYY